MSEKLTVYEKIAIDYCKRMGLDPQERVSYQDPHGHAVLRFAPRYKVLAEEAKNQLAWSRAIKRVFDEFWAQRSEQMDREFYRDIGPQP